MLQTRCELPRLDELVLQRPRPIQNILDKRGRNSDCVFEPLRKVQNKTVGCLCRRYERLFGAVSLCDGLFPRSVRQDSGDGRPDGKNEQQGRTANASMSARLCCRTSSESKSS